MFEHILVVIAILLIIGYIYVNRVYVTENFSESFIDIDQIKYGKMNTKDREFAQNHEIKSFPLPLPLNDIKPHPINSGKLTHKEIDFIIALTQKATKSQIAATDKYEGNILQEFLKYCKKNKLNYNTKYLQKLRDDIKAFCYQLKNIYNRPRPHQLAVVYGKHISCRPIIRSETPSYPSYSTLLSKTLASVITHNNPKHENDLHMIAKEVELSRLSGGFNYPSDNQVSLKIAEILKKYVKLRKS